MEEVRGSSPLSPTTSPADIVTRKPRKVGGTGHLGFESPAWCSSCRSSSASEHSVVAGSIPARRDPRGSPVAQLAEHFVVAGWTPAFGKPLGG